MKKILIVFIGILLCGCIPFSVDNLNTDTVYSKYFLPTKHLKSTDYRKIFELPYRKRIDYINSLSKSIDMEKYFIENGADCIEHVCYFYFQNQDLKNQSVFYEVDVFIKEQKIGWGHYSVNNSQIRNFNKNHYNDINVSKAINILYSWNGFEFPPVNILFLEKPKLKEQIYNAKSIEYFFKENGYV